MMRIDRKAASRIATIAMAGLLGAAAGPLHAAQEAPTTKPRRVLDFRTCLMPEYPKADLRAEHMGTVTIMFLVAADGTIRDSKIAKSSGYDSLDQAARTSLATCRYAPAADPNEAPQWFPIQYRWVIDDTDDALAAPMSPATQEQAFLLTARFLAQYRNSPMVRASQASQATAPVLDRYLKALDPERVLFTRSDIAGFEARREQLARSDDSKQLGAAFAMFDEMRTRRMAMLDWYGEAIRAPLPALDTHGPARPAVDSPWPASAEERQALWRQRLADEARSLRDAGLNDSDIVALLKRRHANRLAEARALGTRDAFELFMNAYVSAFDPDAVYDSPQHRRPAHTEPPGQVGIGLVLKKRGEWSTIQQLIADGPAARSGQLHLGERIVGVAQGVGQPVTDVVGWRLDDVVPLLRGAPGSTVVLTVRPAGAQAKGATRSVTLVRGQQPGPDASRHASAKLEVLERSTGSYRIGVITIPVLYADLDAKRNGAVDYASTAREVAELLASLKAQRADAILLDMRGSGGGSLTEAIDLAGLFLPRERIAQQRDFEGKTLPEFAADRAGSWDGPLAVLIDASSAGGTEIFAAALQDHGKGLVIGERSAGRSGVQSRILLDRFAPNRSVHYGTIRLTVGQLFRVNGTSFEQTGVVPDVDVPGVPEPRGSARHLPFPITPIRPVEFKARGEIKALAPELAQRHAARTAADSAYQAMLRARAQPAGNDGTDDFDIARVQLREALNVVGDEVELLRAGSAAGR